MQGLSYVCISLTRSPERRKRMLGQFSLRRLDARIFDAIDIEVPVELVPGYDVKARRRCYGYPLNKGEVGCYMSHRAVWRQLLDSHDAAWCVMEDDILISEAFKPAVEGIFARREDWDVVRLTYLNDHHQVEYAVLDDSLKLMWMGGPANGMQAYLITRHGAARLLDQTRRILHAIDVVLDRQWEHRLRLFVTSPELAEHVGLISTINPEPPPRQPLLIRLRAKFWRRLGKCRSGIYNWRHRPVLCRKTKADRRSA